MSIILLCQAGILTLLLIHQFTEGFLLLYIWQHIETILKSYEGGLPLAYFLKNYYKQHPRLGSRDRKILSEMAYAYFRVDKAIVNRTLLLTERIRMALFLAATDNKFCLQFLEESWQQQINAPFEAKYRLLEALSTIDLAKNEENLAPLSTGIDPQDYVQALLQKPRVFVRIVKQKELCLKLLEQNGILFQQMDGQCIALEPGYNIDTLLPPDCFVIQDYSSQQVGRRFKPRQDEKWLDCCAGAGGKSLYLMAQNPGIDLTVSDQRQSILHNLKERFIRYHYPLPHRYCIDVSDKNNLQAQLKGRKFDAVICDVPCSGSGTWGRTPEQLYYFKQEDLAVFARRQKQILQNILPLLKPRGRLFYITCSIFHTENEAVVQEALAGQGHLVVRHQQLINGIPWRADSMFVAEITTQ